MFMEFQADWKSVHYIKNYTQLLVHGQKVNIKVITGWKNQKGIKA